MFVRRAVIGTIAAGLTVAASALPATASEPKSSLSSTGGLSTSAAAKPANLAPNAAVGFAVTNARCFSNAITFTAETWENGRSGVQQFRQQARLQEFRGSWVNISALSKVKSVKFPNDTRNFSFTRDWTANHAANGASHRVIWQGFYLNGFGQAIFKTRKITVNCL